MKKFLVIISFILLMTLGIVSCGKSEESNKTQIDETNNEEQQINNNDEKIEEEKPEEEVKVERQEALMMIQQGISEEKNNNKIGNKYEVLVEEQIEDNVYVGRTIYDAEEIDAIVYVKSIRNLQVGEFVNVVITDALEYDLMGVIEDEFTE